MILGPGSVVREASRRKIHPRGVHWRTQRESDDSEVCAGATGHTEGIYVCYDPSQTSYAKMLEHFWSEHSPTYKSKSQYKSAIWAQDEEQYELAVASKTKAEKETQRTMFTDIFPPSASLDTAWWDAEAYHQKYYCKPRQSRFGW
jgi:peptide-methionine (S)-S-oxide reductase